METPKKFFVFIGIAQLILTGGHFLLYLTLVFFFPFFAYHWLGLLITLMVLSVSFLGASILDFQKEDPLLRFVYLVAAVWIPAPIYFLLAALISLAIFIFFPTLHPAIWAAPIFGLAALLTVYGAINARVIRTVTYRVTLPNLPEYWKGKTTVLVSDLHLGHVLRQGSAKKIIRHVQKLNPEIVLIPGDFFDGVSADFGALAAPFKKLRPPHGILFCSGNHELYAGMDKCLQALRQAGITVMDGQMRAINGVQFAGIGYEHDSLPDFKERLSALKLDPNRPSILLKHVPLQIKEAAESGISFQVSGHTHKGQLWPGPLITKRYFKGLDYGLKIYGKMRLIVSSGVGTWGPPVRLLTQAEIVEIIFE